MKTFLVVEQGYEYNDEFYNVNDGYNSITGGFVDEAKAIAEAQARNLKTIEDMGEYFQDDEGRQIIPWKVVEVEVETGREIADLRKARAKVQAALEEANKIAKATFAGVSEELFRAHPILASFKWSQYTPFFNDGDTCTFSANTDYPTIGYTDGTEDEDFYGPEDEKKPTEKEKAGLAVIAFLSEFEDRDFEAMFGDHMAVTVKRGVKGIEVETEEYDHE